MSPGSAENFRKSCLYSICLRVSFFEYCVRSCAPDFETTDLCTDAFEVHVRVRAPSFLWNTFPDGRRALPRLNPTTRVPQAWKIETRTFHIRDDVEHSPRQMTCENQPLLSLYDYKRDST